MTNYALIYENCTPFIELPTDVYRSFPEPPFKLSCGDKPEVRQWLKDNGCEWYIKEPQQGRKFLIVRENLDIDSWHNSAEEKGYKLNESPEITPIIAEVPVTTTEMKVVGYSVNESSKEESLEELQEKLKEEQEKLLQASEEIAKITKQINGLDD